MSTGTLAPQDTPGSSTTQDTSDSPASQDTSGSRTTRRTRRILVWGLVVVLVAAIGALIGGMDRSNTMPLDPDNAEDDGTRALVRVLEQQGVDVTVTRSLSSLQGTDLPADSTVVVVGSPFLGQEAGEQVREYAAGADRLVLLSPDPQVGDVLGLPFDTRSTPQVGAADPGCEATLVTWRDGDRISNGDTLVNVTGDRADAQACFPPSPSYNVGGALSGYVVELPATGDRPEVVVAGIASSLTNEHITEEANAAAGLRILGKNPHLIWHIPAIGDAGDDTPPQTLGDVLPDAFAPGVTILVLALAAAMVWRGRRLGPVVTEPLPAVIRSVETTQSRGRMYRRAGDRQHALAALQLAARRRLAARLGLPVHAPPPVVVQAVAQATGRHTEELGRILADPTAPDDETLVRIARALRALEEGMIG